MECGAFRWTNDAMMSVQVDGAKTLNELAISTAATVATPNATRTISYASRRWKLRCCWVWRTSLPTERTKVAYFFMGEKREE